MKNLMTLSVSTVMARTGFPRCRVYRLIKAGKLQAIREGQGAMRVLETSLDAYYAQATVTPTAGAVNAPSREARRRAADDAVAEGENVFA